VLSRDRRGAVARTENWRTNTRGYRFSRLGDGGDDPCYLIGWVTLERPWAFKNATGQDRYDQTWQVWLDITEGRVWLKLERHGRWTDRGVPGARSRPGRVVGRAPEHIAARIRRTEVPTTAARLLHRTGVGRRPSRGTANGAAHGFDAEPVASPADRPHVWLK
jgi:hypothetical protein